MNREEFERGYAERSGMTIEQLSYWGRYAERCDCGDENCGGWQMGYQHSDALWDDAMRDRK